MKNIQFICALIFGLGIITLSCNTSDNPTKVSAQSATPLDSFKAEARTGDLILRLGDDMVSYSIKFLSQKDPSFSHAGIVMERNGAKFVFHISPSVEHEDSIQLEPIDSFFNPKKNLSGALYRYELSPPQLQAFINQLRQFQTAGAKFDRKYELNTNDQVYCTEMIAKSLAKATDSSFVIKPSHIPANMVNLVHTYFKNENVSREEVVKRIYIAIDNLYLSGKCKEVRRIQLTQAN